MTPLEIMTQYRLLQLLSRLSATNRDMWPHYGNDPQVVAKANDYLKYGGMRVQYDGMRLATPEERAAAQPPPMMRPRYQDMPDGRAYYYNPY